MIQFMYNNSNNDKVTTYKYLVVYLNDKLDWSHNTLRHTFLHCETIKGFSYLIYPDG